MNEVTSVSSAAFPSIWLGDFRSRKEYEARAPRLAEAFSVFDWVDDRLLHSRHAFAYRAYCATCDSVTAMQVSWVYGAASPNGSMHPAWTETAACERCGLNSRMRALIDFLKTRCHLDKVRHAYLAEQTTPSYRRLKALLPSLVGSEYLGPEHESGATVTHWRRLHRVRHEDLTRLSFASGEFDLVITQDVFEHVPGYHKAFAEIRRVLAAGGRLVFTIPFFPELATTRIRASLGANGIEHHLPPEIHGNPVSDEGSLCFQNFGWDILEDLARAGFSDAMGSMYWGPWQGHLGFPFFVFSAQV